MNILKTLLSKASPVLVAGAISMMSFIAGPAAAAWKPDGTLTVLIGFGAGGSTDTLGRVLAKVMKEQTGWNIIVENKTGGGGIAMFTGIAKMPPRGKVIGLGVNMPVLVNLVRRPNELAFKLDSFDYLGTISKAELALVAAADAPFDDLPGMIAYARQQGTLAVAFGAPPQKLLIDVTAIETDTNFNMVTTKGGAETMKLILGGQVMVGFSSGEHFPHAEAGKMKIIAGASAKRLSYAPDVGTFVDAGINAYVDPWYYLATTKGTDPAALKAISKAISNALKSPEMKEIARNTIKNDPLNLGPSGTRQMMIDGVSNVRVLFGQ